METEMEIDAEMEVAIDGVDITPYIAFGGFRWQRSDIDGPDAGRDLEAQMHRDRVATKRRLDITCRPLTSQELSKILTLLMPEQITVTYYDPQEGKKVTKTMYSNNNTAQFFITRKNGQCLWNGVTFPLIEV